MGTEAKEKPSGSDTMNELVRHENEKKEYRKRLKTILLYVESGIGDLDDAIEEIVIEGVLSHSIHDAINMSNIPNDSCGD